MTGKPGPQNLITDVAGILVGNAEDPAALSGTTVILPDKAATAAVDVRGGGPGTRETDLLGAAATVEKVDAIVLSGGSAFGLDAAGGVMAWLAARGRGFPVKDAVVPIVPAAILFDLANGGDKDWGDTPPYRALGSRAAGAAASSFALGNAGAGLGATAGALKGGLGSASLVLDDGFAVGALAAVNAMGSVTFPDSDAFYAWPFERGGEFGGRRPGKDATAHDLAIAPPDEAGANMTLACIATDAALSRRECQRIAVMAQDGLARAIRPVHSPLDGDTVFVLATGARPLTDPVFDVARIGAVAADCLARACARGVFEADSVGAHTAYRDLYRG